MSKLDYDIIVRINNKIDKEENKIKVYRLYTFTKNKISIEVYKTEVSVVVDYRCKLHTYTGIPDNNLPFNKYRYVLDCNGYTVDIKRIKDKIFRLRTIIDGDVIEIFFGYGTINWITNNKY